MHPPFFQLLDPSPSAAAMAFLGAYFFAVYLVLRGYFRGDLRPKLYNQITARLVTVVVIAYLLNALYADTSDNRVLWMAAFLAGIVPSTVLRGIGVAGAKALSAVGDRADEQSRLASGFQKAFATPRALTKIDGVDLYESARLETEGITDITALARSDLVSTMISTRLPVDRLMDWTDQAILLMLLDDGADPDEPGERVKALRRLGIRTASSLARTAEDETASPRRASVEAALGGGKAGASLLTGLAQLIDGERSIHRIEHWRTSEIANLEKPVRVITEYEPPRTAVPAAAVDGHTRSRVVSLARLVLPGLAPLSPR